MTEPTSRHPRGSAKPRAPHPSRETHPARRPNPATESRWIKEADKPSKWSGTFSLGRENQFSLPQEMVDDPDYDYEWMTASVLERPFPEIIARGERNGWERVDPNREKRVATEIGGQVLMVRPKFIGEKWKAFERQAAEGAITRLQQKAGEGIPVSGGDHPSARGYNKHVKSYERITVPDSE